jgi:hypothetical protein
MIQRRPKQCYDDECCIAPGELDEEENESIQETNAKMKSSLSNTTDSSLARSELMSSTKASQSNKTNKLASHNENGHEKGCSTRVPVPKVKSSSSLTVR